MFMEYLHLMLDINVLTNQMSKSPNDLRLSSIYVQNISRSRSLWNDLYEAMRSVELNTKFIDDEGFYKLVDYMLVLNTKVGQNRDMIFHVQQPDHTD